MPLIYELLDTNKMTNGNKFLYPPIHLTPFSDTILDFKNYFWILKNMSFCVFFLKKYNFVQIPYNLD